MAEARAVAWRAWHGLLKQGKDPLAVGVHGIAHNAIRFVRNRRRIGNRSAGRGAMDVFHPRAQQARNFRVISLDREGEIAAEQPRQASWREWLAEDNRVSPADEAAFHLDFEAWLASLHPTKRQVAEMLAAGHEGIVVAKAIGVSPARVCQLRRELEASWQTFQGNANEPPISTLVLGFWSSISRCALIRDSSHRRSLPMGARSKLNLACLNGSLVLAGAVGMLTGSWSVFGMSLFALLLTSLFSGGIRMRSRIWARGWHPR